MADRITLPDVSDDENRLVNRLLERLEDKADRNLLRESYYDGKRAIRQVGTVIPPQYYRLGLVLGWSAKAVDLMARRCHLEEFVWPDGDLGSLGAAEVLENNHWLPRFKSAIKSSLIHSTAFLINTRGDVSAGEPASLLHVKDARNATGDWNTRLWRLDNLLSVIARDPEGRPTELALYLHNETITAFTDENGRWQVDRSEHPWGVPAEALVYKPREDRPFGSSRISRPVMALQDQATREVIRLEGHMDVYSFPEMVMLGADTSIFRNADGTQKAAWQIMLGRWKGIPDDDGAENPRADVKQFPAASPQPHLAALNAFAKLMAREASLPDTALAITDVSNPTSAESYDASQYELIAEAEGAIEEWTLPARRSMLRALAIANGEDKVPAEWMSLDTRWRDPRYQSRAAMADAGAKQVGAVDWLKQTEVGLELLGLSPQQIRRALAERRRLEGRQAMAQIVAATGQQQQPQPPPPESDADGRAGEQPPR